MIYTRFEEDYIEPALTDSPRFHLPSTAYSPPPRTPPPVSPLPPHPTPHVFAGSKREAHIEGTAAHAPRMLEQRQHVLQNVLQHMLQHMLQRQTRTGQSEGKMEGGRGAESPLLRLQLLRPSREGAEAH